MRDDVREKDMQSVAELVHGYYWDDDLNCATTSMLIFSRNFGVKIDPQVLDATFGMHGAGRYGAQCGLVEGALMFMGILGRQRGMTDDEITEFCYRYAEAFEREFQSLLCRELRPEGFHPENPPQLCERLSVHAIEFGIEMIGRVAE